MCKVMLVDEESGMKNFVISEMETINQILLHYNMDPDKKIVYLNGSILSRTRMEQPLNMTGTAFLAVKNKRYIRV